MPRNPGTYALTAFMFLLLFSAPANGGPSTRVFLTEVAGSVYKRAFVDWNREQWGEPVPARRGDELFEGMQIGTGERSRAQVTWPYVTTRAWSNSVYAIAPNQRLVFLLSGEMLYQLDKNRKGRGEYYVWTKLIQARMRGTTLLFQCQGDTTRVAVLEGCADVLNCIDKSVIRIKPGVVLEVQEKTVPGSITESPSAHSLQPITTGKMLPVFETERTSTRLLTANAFALLEHPLVAQPDSPLKSLSLVERELSGFCTAVDVAPLSSLAKIVSVPKRLNYAAGAAVDLLSMPANATQVFPPSMAMKSAAGPVLVGSTDLIHKRPVNSLARKVGELGKALAKSGTHFIDETGRAGAGVANGAAAVADTFANNATKPLALGGTATQPGISAGVTSNGNGTGTSTSTSTGITSRPGNLELPAVVLPFSRGKNNLIDAGSLTNIILGK